MGNYSYHRLCGQGYNSRDHQNKKRKLKTNLNLSLWNTKLKTSANMRKKNS